MKVQTSFTYKELKHIPGGYLIYTKANRFYISRDNEVLFSGDDYNDCYRRVIATKMSSYQESLAISD